MRNFTYRMLLQLLAIIVLGATMTGCERDNSDLQRYIQAVKEKPGNEIPPIPDVIAYHPFDYPDHHRNPFDEEAIASQLIPEQKPVNSIRVDADRVREYLESFPLDALKMVGTLNQNKSLWGLIRTPDGTIQRVASGNYLGQNHGKIKSITEKGLDLIEIIPDGYGGYMERPASIALTIN